ncbi:MAG: helix-turn-helix domain-containing protein [Actinobacteria bacterium]|nr:helix-turn-helix domain-containing protein [Actinomycetota bacterium]MBI3687310.1 helix-turn-helix domain-containing protein [Actinomycetota bacterium]
MSVGPHGPDPTVHRRRLRNELRKARETAGKTQRDAAAAMEWSQSKLIRIETGAVNISTNDLRALLAHYGVEDARVEALVELARAARDVPRWSIYKDVATPEYISFLGYESSASIIRNFEPLLIPGLLQTEEYAREVISTVEDHTPPQRIDALVDLRMQRQEIFVRNPTPLLHFIIDEAVIHRMVGGHGVARRQLRRLRDAADIPNVTIRIVPFTQGMYPRLRVPYVLFEFPEVEDEDVLFLENPFGDFVIRENSPEEKDKINPVNYLGIFWQLEQIANREVAPAMLDGALTRLERWVQRSALQTGETSTSGDIRASEPAN